MRLTRPKLPEWLDRAICDHPDHLAVAGTHPESGWVCITFDRPGDFGKEGIPRTEIVLDAEVAKRLAVQLLAAADPSLVVERVLDYRQRENG